MNIYFIVIISVLIFDYLLSLVVDFLNIKSLDPNLPEEFSDTFDKEKYIKSQEYTKTQTTFSHFSSTFSLVISLSFILGGVYNIIDLYVRSLGYSEIVTGLLFFGLLSVITDLLSLPFSFSFSL